MGKVNQALLAFNRGLISKLGIARIDVPKVALSAEIQTNWFPRLLGSMMLRPGTKYIGSTYNNNKALFTKFIYNNTQRALIEFTDSIIRFWVDDALIARPSVTTTITNGSFATDLTGWTNADQTGATSQWATGNYMQLVGTGINQAIRYQGVSTGANQGIQHAVRVVIERGPITFKIGSTLYGDDFVSETILGTGTHSLAFLPTTANFYITFSSFLQRITLVKSIQIESAGVVTLPSPYTETLLPSIRTDQSLDTIYVACGNTLQQRILQRRGSAATNYSSWSIILYQPEDGPVKATNTSQITLSASDISGNITVTASQSLFKTGHVGAIFKHVSIGQNIAQGVSAANTFTTGYIIVTGVGDARYFTVTITGTWVGTVTLQRSFDEGASWIDAVNYTTNQNYNYDDGLTNSTVRYRIGIKTGNYTSGTANVSLSYASGSITGYFRITSYTSTTSVAAEVLKSLGSTTATTKWNEGEWSDYRGYPSAIALSEGRLFWAGLSKIIGSISDAYLSFDDTVTGDSGLISRDLGSGATNQCYWMASLYRLFIGVDTSVKGIKTTSFEEPMTPTNFKVVEPTTQSCSNVKPAKLDKKLIFVQGAGTRIFELAYDQNTIDYAADELTKAVPEVGKPSVVRLDTQRQPDTMIHCVRSDGKVAILLYDILENLKAWFLYETDGEVEDVVTFPGPNTVEDYVYYSIKRTINGQTVRYLEKFAFQQDCQGDILNKQADSFIEYSGAPTSTITGLSHLEGEEVIVWADGKDLSPSNLTNTNFPPSASNPYIQATYTVTGGQITLGQSVSNAIVGLPYTAQYQSSKLAYASSSPLGARKMVNSIGVIMNNTHSKGLLYNSSFDGLNQLPNVNPVAGTITPYNTIFSEIDTPMFNFGGSWNTDSRVCLQAQAPRPCTLLAIEIAITTNEKQ
jgi:hypothetical protein